jgi:hypothetical protein
VVVNAWGVVRSMAELSRSRVHGACDVATVGALSCVWMAES